MAEPIERSGVHRRYRWFQWRGSMRGGFNNNLAVRYGTRSVAGPPLTVYGTDIPCRKVFQHEIGQRQFPLSLTSFWLTLDSLDLHGPLVSSPWLGAVFSDYLASDQVSFADAPDVWYCVCREEHLTPFEGTVYDRWLILPLTSVVYPFWLPPHSPPPAPPPPVPVPVAPGELCSTATPFDGFGYWSFSSVDPGAPGFVGAVFSWAGDIRVRVLNPLPSGAVVYVAEVNPAYSCCEAAIVGSLTPGGDQCVTVHHASGVPYAGRLCIRVDNLDGPDVLTCDIAVEWWACGV